MGTTETELRQHAEADRARMGETLEAIGDRLSPASMVERRKAAVGERFRRVRESVMGSPGYMEPSSGGLRERASQTASSATDAARTAADKMQHAPEMLADQTRGNPLAAGLVAFGAGMLIATAFPRTRTEQRLVATAQPQLESAKQELRDAGRDLADSAKDQAQQAAQEVSSAGKEAASNVADQAKSSAQHVADQARGS